MKLSVEEKRAWELWIAMVREASASGSNEYVEGAINILGHDLCCPDWKSGSFGLIVRNRHKTRAASRLILMSAADNRTLKDLEFIPGSMRHNIKMSIAERRQAPEEVYRGLLREAEAQNISARVYGNLAEIKGQMLIVPIFVAGDLDAFDFASQLQSLEDAWSNQVPVPEWHVILRPAAQ